MAVQTANIYPYNGLDADFRQWGLGISNAIAAAGLVRTADTGQINWTTVLTPTTTNQKRGYEVYRFDDTLQGARPIFIRLDYGSGGYQFNPQMWVTVGTATNGAGTIAAHASFPNSFTAVRTMMYTSSPSWVTTTPAPVYVDSDGAGSLMIAAWFQLAGSGNPTVGGTVTIVERTRNFDGTYNGEGVMVLTADRTFNVQTQMIWLTNAPYLAAQPTVFTGAYGMYPLPGTPAPTAGYMNGIQYFYPVFTGTTPQLHGPSKHVVSMVASDMPVLAQFDLTHYGVSKRWIVTNQVGFDASGANRGCVRIS